MTVAALLAMAALGATEPPPRAVFALLIGVNKSVDPSFPVLHYADDDAAAYQTLFRTLGARTYLLTRLDENTRRLQPQAAAEAREPVLSELRAAVSYLASDVAQARARGLTTELYVVYAGHGNVQDGRGYIALEDARLTGKDLKDEVLARIEANRIHLIVDSCYSYFLAYSRGPGGERHPVKGFSQLSELTADPRVGLLLSTSSARESHEWDAFQGGVFSHEVRSGLFGAADANGDGQVTYREIAAFVQQANAAIPNEKYRPDVHARAPEDSDALIDLRPGLGRRLEVQDSQGAHYLMEDGRGVRLLDFHDAPGVRTALLRPASDGPLFLRRLSDGQEFQIPTQPDVVSLADLQPQPPRVAGRGAAHEAFDLLFALPFSQQIVDAFHVAPPADVTELPMEAPPTVARNHRLAVGAGVLAVLAVAGGAYCNASAQQTATSALPTDSQQTTATRNGQINGLNAAAVSLYAGAGAAATAAVLLWLWPAPPIEVAPAASERGASLLVSGSF